MNNFGFDVTSLGDEHFVATLKLALEMRGFKKATHYRIGPSAGRTPMDVVAHRLVFFWAEPKDLPKDARASALPYEMDHDAIASFALHWLKNGAVYGKRPDHDGDNSRGWRVFVEDWGHVDGSFYGLIGVQPVWAMHGK